MSTIRSNNVRYIFFVLLPFLCCSLNFASAVEKDSLLILGIPDNIAIEYGRISFGVENPYYIAKSKGYEFKIQGNIKENNGYWVYGFNTSKEDLPQVWKAYTEDGINFTDARLLYEIPKNIIPIRSWKDGSIALGNDRLVLLQCEIGNPSLKGHPFHVFSGTLNGDSWEKLTKGTMMDVTPNGSRLTSKSQNRIM